MRVLVSFFLFYWFGHFFFFLNLFLSHRYNLGILNISVLCIYYFLKQHERIGLIEFSEITENSKICSKDKTLRINKIISNRLYLFQLILEVFSNYAGGDGGSDSFLCLTKKMETIDIPATVKLTAAMMTLVVQLSLNVLGGNVGVWSAADEIETVPNVKRTMAMRAREKDVWLKFCNGVASLLSVVS